MRGCLTIFGALFFMMVLYYMGQERTPEANIPQFETKIPDSTREIDHFDWAKNDYVYKDQIPPDTQPRRHRIPEPYPDFHVRIIGERTPKTRKPYIVTHKGKRVKVYEKANGEIDLIPLN